MAFAARGGRRIAWNAIGDGTPLLLVPGLGAGASLFGTLPRRFARHGLRCLVFDPIGVPPSSPRAPRAEGAEGGGDRAEDRERDIYDLDEAAQDVLAVLDAAELDTCTLVGTSLGGKVALAVAQRAPARVAKLVLLASSAVVTPRAKRVYRFFEVAAQRLESAELAAVVAPFLFGGTFHRERPEVVDDIVRAMRFELATRRLMVAQARALQRFDGVPMAGAYAGPALCVAGTEDTLTGADEVRETAALLPGGRYLEIARAGHSLLLESPAVFEAITSFALAAG